MEGERMTANRKMGGKWRNMGKWKKGSGEKGWKVDGR
jgi:hypothetical protein